ncbi:unnamed protein product [Microthlaspi erraticum]|uniref:Uncharacterized protein n=1 Tax=Microthlaspi erraticum TaxID=1685480 RepID=A0A6D2KBP1_9BRAS|nr:unnamed protein product [Microthlaspi erraticum]
MSSRSMGSVEDVGGDDAPVFLFRLLLFNDGSAVFVGDVVLVASGDLQESFPLRTLTVSNASTRVVRDEVKLTLKSQD